MDLQRSRACPRKEERLAVSGGSAAVGQTLASPPWAGDSPQQQITTQRDFSNVVASEYWSNQQHWNTLGLVPSRLSVAKAAPMAQARFWFYYLVAPVILTFKWAC